MKKALLALSIVSISFAACSSGNNKTNEVTTSDTSNIVKQDTMQVIKDTTVKTTVSVDTAKVDTSNNK